MDDFEKKDLDLIDERLKEAAQKIKLEDSAKRIKTLLEKIHEEEKKEK